MSFDEIFDLTAGVYFNFYNIYTKQHSRYRYPTNIGGSSNNIGLRMTSLQEYEHCRIWSVMIYHLRTVSDDRSSGAHTVVVAPAPNTRPSSIIRKPKLLRCFLGGSLTI